VFACAISVGGIGVGGHGLLCLASVVIIVLVVISLIPGCSSWVRHHNHWRTILKDSMACL
jgi:hypothetical protein